VSAPVWWVHLFEDRSRQVVLLNFLLACCVGRRGGGRLWT